MIGFTGLEDQGQEGIELAQQSQLAGTAGQRRVIKDRKGRIVEDIENLKAPREGKALRLSIDEKFQYLAHRELKAAVDTTRPRAARWSCSMPRPAKCWHWSTSRITIPNNRAQWNPKQARNRSVTDTFEPGSTFKPFAISAALEAGIVQARYRHPDWRGSTR